MLLTFKRRVSQDKLFPLELAARHSVFLIILLYGDLNCVNLSPCVKNHRIKKT